MKHLPGGIGLAPDHPRVDIKKVAEKMVRCRARTGFSALSRKVGRRERGRYTAGEGKKGSGPFE
jgi:hypothetical protein